MDIIDFVISNPSLITAIATLVVAIATVYYAITNHRLWRRMEINSKRANVLDEMKFITKPVLNHITEEINKLKREDLIFDISSNKSYLEKIEFHESIIIVYNAFIKRNKSLKEYINRHNQLIDDLESEYKEFIKYLKSKNYLIKINKLLVKFDETGPPKIIKKLDANSVPNLVLIHTLKNTDIKENFLGEPFKSFWKEFGKEFISKRNQKRGKNYLNNIQLYENRLNKINKQIKKYLIDKLTVYVEDYGISLDEIEAKDMTKEEEKKYIWKTGRY